MINKLPLKDIAEIYSGYAFREAIIPSANGNIQVIQAKDIKSGEPISATDSLVKIATEIPRSNSFVKCGDVLLASRGAGSHKATVFEPSETNIVASASLYIIRPSVTDITPDYLALYLNSADGQNQLSQLTTGAYIKNITRNNLEQLKIPVPPIAQQKTLVALQSNIWQQEQILSRKRNLTNSIINQAINKISER